MWKGCYGNKLENNDHCETREKEEEENSEVGGIEKWGWEYLFVHPLFQPASFRYIYGTLGFRTSMSVKSKIARCGLTPRTDFRDKFVVLQDILEPRLHGKADVCLHPLDLWVGWKLKHEMSLVSSLSQTDAMTEGSFLASYTLCLNQCPFSSKGKNKHQKHRRYELHPPEQ